MMVEKENGREEKGKNQGGHATIEGDCGNGV